MWLRRCSWRRLLLLAAGVAAVGLLLSRLHPPALLERLWTPTRSGQPLSYPHNFRYLINNDVCGDRGGSEPVEAIIVVHSDPRRPQLRDAIRESLPAATLRRLGLRRAFMLADASEAYTAAETTVPQSAIAAESERHQDVVQGNFHDSYFNLTYKHIMALDWANTHCSQARLIVKMDDDIVFDVYGLQRLLRQTPATNYLGGEVFHDSVPYRKGESKWAVSYNYWARSRYPPYLSGWLYLVSPDVARGLVLQATVVPFFWIDDTFVTGILAEQLPISISSLRSIFVTEEKCLRKVVDQQFRLDAPSSTPVYEPGFVVGPSGKELQVIRRFNELAEYCHTHGCQQRARLKICQNNF